jgi:recombination protein RecR
LEFGVWSAGFQPAVYGLAGVRVSNPPFMVSGLRVLWFSLVFFGFIFYFLFFFIFSVNSGQYPSVLLENAVSELAALPGIGRKTALRLALHVLRREESYAERLSTAISTLRRDIRYCRECHNICDAEVCSICANPLRDRTTVCVVENIREVMAIENTAQYNGVYHVLGGVISPVDGIGPGDLETSSLIDRVARGDVKEVIFALRTTMEGDTTNFYLWRKLEPYNVCVSVIARGVSVGDEIEYADEITLGRSIINRVSFNDSLKR